MRVKTVNSIFSPDISQVFCSRSQKLHHQKLKSKAREYTAQDYELLETQILYPQSNAQRHQGMVSREMFTGCYSFVIQI